MQLRRARESTFDSPPRRGLARAPAAHVPSAFELDDGARVAVIGGGPAGSFFACFFRRLAESLGLDAAVDIYEPKDRSCTGPSGCNHCGGIISETLVQMLALEGINLPDTVVQRGIDSYMLHMDVGSVRIRTPLREKRIAAVFRGAGPRGTTGLLGSSFDGYLQRVAEEHGATMIQERVAGLEWRDDRPVVRTKQAVSEPYDLAVVAVGVNSAFEKIIAGLGLDTEPPRTAKTYICELHLGRDAIHAHLGRSMHVFLLDLPRLEFAALIPKGDYVTLCLLGDDIDRALIQAFLDAPEVRACLPPDLDPGIPACKCSPKLNVRGATRPFSDRVVLVGDCGITRLYKDGIGAAYRTAKAAAETAVFHGVGAADFRAHYWPACRLIDSDNTIGRAIFSGTRIVQKARFMRRAILRMVDREQRGGGRRPRMSAAVWDLFTGSAPYREVLGRACHPVMAGRFLGNLALGALPTRVPAASGNGDDR
ncbi:MAG: NAD(P)/FAD-dependent oxidoreductase [Planctomycetota bacterium]|jgi:flavin-dependent dehydrogenase